MNSPPQNLRYALRQRKTPFAAVAVLTLALGTCEHGRLRVMNSVLSRMLPV
jgi:hypothetical protein